MHWALRVPMLIDEGEGQKDQFLAGIFFFVILLEKREAWCQPGTTSNTASKNEAEAVKHQIPRPRLQTDHQEWKHQDVQKKAVMVQKGQLEPSTVQQFLSKKFNELRKEIRATELIECKKEITGMKEFSEDDVLYCSERVQRKVVEISKQQEVKIMQERVKELMLEPFARTLEDYEDGVLKLSREVSKRRDETLTKGKENLR